MIKCISKSTNQVLPDTPIGHHGVPSYVMVDVVLGSEKGAALALHPLHPTKIADNSDTVNHCRRNIVPMDGKRSAMVR